MLVLKHDLRVTAFDHAGHGDVNLSTGTKVRAVKIQGAIATCVMGSPTYSISFNVPMDAVRKIAQEPEEEVRELTPEEVRGEHFEELEGLLEEEEPGKRKPKKYFEPGLTVKTPGELLPEEELGEMEPEFKEPDESEGPPDILTDVIRDLPPSSTEKFAPPEFNMKVEFPAWWWEYMPSMFTYPDTGPMAHRFLGIENTKLRVGWVLIDTLTAQTYEAGTVERAVEIANELILIANEMQREYKEQYEGYSIRQDVDLEPPFPALEYKIYDASGALVGNTKTYDKAVELIDAQMGKVA
jgi:hypothetical protein